MVLWAILPQLLQRECTRSNDHVGSVETECLPSRLKPWQYSSIWTPPSPLPSPESTCARLVSDAAATVADMAAAAAERGCLEAEIAGLRRHAVFMESVVEAAGVGGSGARGFVSAFQTPTDVRLRWVMDGGERRQSEHR